MKNGNQEEEHSDGGDDGIFRRLLKDSGWLLGSGTIQTGLSALQGIFVARFLGVEQFGVFALIAAFTASVNQLVDSRVWETAIKFVTKHRENNEPARANSLIQLCYLIDIATALLAMLIIWLAAPWAARVFVKDEAVFPLIRIFSFTLLLGCLVGTSTALFRVAKRFNWLAFRDSTMAIVKLVLVVVALVGGFGIQGVVIALVAGAAIDLVLVVWLVRPALAELNIRVFDKLNFASLKTEFRHSFSFLAITNIIAFTKLFQKQAGTLVTGLFLGPVSVGYLRLAKRLADLMLFPSTPIFATAFPEFTRLWHKPDIPGLTDLFWRLTKLLSVGSIALGIGCMVVAPFAIPILVGDEYLPSLPLLYVFAFANIFQISLMCGPQLLRAVDRVNQALVANVASVTAYLIALFALVPTTGVIGAAFAHLILVLVWATISTINLRQFIRFARYSKPQLESVASENAVPSGAPQIAK